MRIVIIMLSLFLATSCLAEVKLWRFTDKISGEERGISYSDKNGNPPINNSDWNAEEISENEKEHYANFYRQQLKDKQNQVESALKDKKNKAKLKLKTQGFTDDEIGGIMR